MNTFSQPPVFAYLETSVPVGMTLADYRRELPRRPSRAARVRAALSGLRPRMHPDAAVPAAPAETC